MRFISPFTTQTSRGLCLPLGTPVHLEYQTAGRRVITSKELEPG
jgi:hypothetical protein